MVILICEIMYKINKPLKYEISGPVGVSDLAEKKLPSGREVFVP